jgi:putative PEP-CTERM system TPR-repeat lipoprotein
MKRRGLHLTALAILACAASLSGCDWFVSADQRVTRAEQKLAAADDRGALIELQNAVRSEPGNVRAHLLLVDISLRLGDLRSARKELQEAVTHGATADQTAELSAKVALTSGEFKELLAQLDSDQAGLATAARFTYRGLALLGMNDLDKAAEAFNQALSADPKWARARIGLAETLAAQGNSEAGLEQLQIVLAANASDATAALLKGTILAKRGDYRAAAAALKIAREHGAVQLSSSQRALTLAALTEAQLALGDLQAAQAAHAELVQLAPSSQLTRLLAARLAMVKQDYTTAVAEAQKVVTAAPDLVAAKMLLGAALLAQGNLNQAETQLSEVVRQAPENMEGRKLLARVNLQLQRPDIAMQVLAPAQQSETADPQLDALLGWANLQRGDGAAAIALLERSVAAQPGNANLQLDLAMAYVSEGQHDKALELLRSGPSNPSDIRRDSLLVASLAAAKGLDAARAEIDRIVAAAPQDVAVLNLAGSFYARQGDFGRARNLLARAVAKEPGNVATLTTQARIEIAAGDQKAAASAIDKALAKDPANMPARLMQVEIAARAGDLATAGKRLEDIRAADAKAVEPRLLLARLYLQQKKTREADDVIREVRAQALNEAPIASAVGRFYLDAGRFEEALSWFRIAAQKDPTNSSYALSVARSQLALGNSSAAHETLQTILAAHPGSIPASTALVMLDLREGRRDAAVARVAELKKVHPQDPAVAMLEGDVAMATKSYKDAAQAYATASKLAPSGTSAVRAYRANQLGGFPDATVPLESWLQRQPADVAVRMVLAEAYAAASQRDRAIEQYEKVAGAERPNPMALNNLAWLYHEKGDERAAATAKRAYAAAPQVPAIADTYGWILLKGGDVKQGLPILQKAVADSKSQPDIRYHYAAALAQAGQREQARRELLALTRGEAKFASAAEAQKLLAELGG